MSTDAFLAMNIPRLRDSVSRRLEEQAQARGHAAGYTEGVRAAQADIDARAVRLEAEHAAAAELAAARVERTLALLGAAAQALHRRTVPLLADSHGALAAAAVELAEAILGYELADHEHSARAAVDRALADVDGPLVRTVRLNPDDLALLDDQALSGTATQTGVDFTADPSLARGDAVTEFADGYLDARIGSALARAKAALLGENS